MEATNSFRNGTRLFFKVGSRELKWVNLQIDMLSDFKTVATDVKLVDDSTLVDTGNKNTKSDRMQEAAYEAFEGFVNHGHCSESDSCWYRNHTTLVKKGLSLGHSGLF